VGSIQTNLNKE